MQMLRSFTSLTVVVSSGASVANAGGARMRPAAPASERVARKRRRVCIVGIGNLPFFRSRLQLEFELVEERQSVFSAMIFFGFDLIKPDSYSRSEQNRTVSSASYSRVVRDLAQRLQGTDQRARRRAALGHGQ
jgi:hypothetical protein